MSQHKVLDRKAYAPGQMVFNEGENGDRAFIIQEGEVEVFKRNGEQESVFGRLGKGAIFGEMALLDDSPRMASARTTESSTLLIVTRDMFNEKLKKTDPFIRGLLHILAETVRDLSQKK